MGDGRDWGGWASSAGPIRAGARASAERPSPYPTGGGGGGGEVAIVKVRCKSKSWQAEVAWDGRGEEGLVWEVRISESGGGLESRAELPAWRRSIKVRVKAGKWYKVAVEGRLGGRVKAKGSADFKSIFDREELLMLYDKCVQFAGHRIERFEVFYRHKPQAYWDNIAKNRNHVMEKYIKDLNGQAASPINDTIYGLFWNANLKHGRLPDSSPFGDIRMCVEPEKLFSPEHKLYFADFYCNFIVHYMTVVVCVAGSETDNFCSKSLIPLDPFNNPFLKIDVLSPGNHRYWVNNGIWVEVYFTENVPTDWAIHSMWKRVMNKGKSKPGGLANNKSCAVCNLYPEGIYPEEDNVPPDPPPPPPKEIEAREVATGIEDSNSAQSTFHLVMETERKALGKRAPEAPPNLDVLDLILDLVDSVVADVGPRIPAPGRMGQGASTISALPIPQAPAKVVEITLDLDDDDDVKEVEEEPAASNAEGKSEEAETELGQTVLEALAATNRRLDAEFKALGRSLTAIQESIDVLEKKARFLPKIPQ